MDPVSITHPMEAVMKPRNLILFFGLLVLFGASACWAAECPIEVKVVQDRLAAGIRITSIADTVTIQGIRVNRGNVKLLDEIPLVGIKGSPLPVTLKFGQYAAYVTEPAPIREVEVQTNMGNWKFTFK